jgi:hypothetical protein
LIKNQKKKTTHLLITRLQIIQGTVKIPRQKQKNNHYRHPHLWLCGIAISLVAVSFLITINNISNIYGPVVQDQDDEDIEEPIEVSPPSQTGINPAPAPSAPSARLAPESSPSNASAVNGSALFIREWGGSCLLSSSTNCIDPDGPTGNLSSGDGQFWGIWGVAANSPYVFVADVLNNRIQKFDLNGSFIRDWGSFCDLSTKQGCLDSDGPVGNLSLGDGQFNKPSGIAVDSEYVFVVDHNNQTQKFDHEGNFVKRWGSSGTADGQFRTPEGIAVDKNLTNVYIADSGNHRIQKFDKEGQHLETWGSFCEIATAKDCVDPDGSAGNMSLGDGQFNYPQGVAIYSNASNNVYVADSGNNRIQKFDNNGTFITRWGSVGNGISEFRRPADLAVHSGIVYAVDAENNRIQEFDTNGMFIRSWGSECLRRYDSPPSSGCIDTDGPSGNLTIGQGQFNRPAGIAVTSGIIIVADNSNDIIQVFNASAEGGVFSAVDKFGVRMLYPTKQGGEEWFLNMENPTNDNRFDPKASITKNSDGSWKMQSDKVRMNVFTSTGYDQNRISSTNHGQLSSKGYMLSPNDWKEVEITGYVKVNSIDADDNFAWYARGGKHGDSDSCEGVSYKGDLFYSGKAQVAKEQLHVNYDKSEEMQVIDSIQGKWVGFKFVIYNIEQNGKTAVKMENWVDRAGDGNWAKVFDIVDSGGWGRQGTSCGGTADQVITWGGPVATFRWDSSTDVDFKFFSVREINAQGGPVPSGVAIGAPGGVASNTMIEREDSAMEEEEEQAGKDGNQKVATSGKYVYVVWTDPPPLENDDIFFKRSVDGGLNFEPEIKLTGTAANSAEPDISAYGKEVYVVWREGDRGKTDIFIRKSDDNGATFGPPIDVSNSSAESSTNPAVAVSTGGQVAVAWSETNTTSTSSSGNNSSAIDDGSSNIFYRASSDSGTSFGIPLSLSNNPPSSLVSSVQPDIAMTPEGDPVVVWSSGNEDDRKIFYAKGTVDKKGIDPDSFGAPISLNNNTSDSSSFAPGVAVSESGEVNVVWKDNGKSGRSDIFSVQSKDGETGFSNPVNISNDTAGSSDPDVSVSENGEIYAVWSGTSPGDNEVFLAKKTTNSTTFEDVSVLTNDSESMPFNPQLALSEGGDVNIVWNNEEVNTSSSSSVKGNMQNITSNNDTTSIQPSIILKKVEGDTNAPLPDAITQSVNTNANPSVNAGQDKFMQLNDTAERQQGITVLLNGSAKDPENDSLVYKWNQIGGKLVDLNSSTSAHTQFNVPVTTLARGNNTFTFELAAYDSKNGVGKDITIIKILKNGTSSPLGGSSSSAFAAGGNQPLPGGAQQTPPSSISSPPNAVARATPTIVKPGQQVSLYATGSNDKDGRISSFVWEQLSGDAVILQGEDKSMATFGAPNRDATLEFRLTVTDNQGQADSTLVQVNVRGADAGSGSTDIEPHSSDEGEDSDPRED